MKGAISRMQHCIGWLILNVVSDELIYHRVDAGTTLVNTYRITWCYMLKTALYNNTFSSSVNKFTYKRSGSTI
jgi:hypothetical protein